jgi:hypothetical protein
VAADSPNLAVPAVYGRPGSVSIAGCTGRTWVLRGSRLEARVGETEARRGAHGGGARPRIFGEESRVQEGGMRGKLGRRCSLPQRGAPGALARRWKVAEWRRIGQPRCGQAQAAKAVARARDARRGVMAAALKGSTGAGPCLK